MISIAELPRPEPGPGHSEGEQLLTRPSRRLLLSGGLVNAGLATSSIFVALFFYVVNGSITGMAVYSVGRYAGLILMSVMVVKAFPSVAPRRLFRCGVGLTAVFYLMLIVLGRHVASLALPLGVFNGVASGVYWFGSNTLIYDVVGPVERGRYYGLSFSLLNVFNVAAPLASGFLIAQVGGEAGYFAVFAMAVLIFSAAWRTARRLPATGGVGGVSVRGALALPFVQTGWAHMWMVVAMRGFKQAAGSLGLVVLVAMATASSSAQGEFAAVSALAGVATSVLAGRLAPDRRPRAMWLGAAGFIAATALLFVRADLAMLLVYGLVAGLAYPALMVPVSSVVLDVMDADPLCAERRGGYILSREVAVNLGRLVAVALLLALLVLVPATVAVLCVLGAAAVLQLAVAGLAVEGLSVAAQTRPALAA